MDMLRPDFFPTREDRLAGSTLLVHHSAYGDPQRWPNVRFDSVTHKQGMLGFETVDGRLLAVVVAPGAWTEFE